MAYFRISAESKTIVGTANINGAAPKSLSEAIATKSTIKQNPYHYDGTKEYPVIESAEPNKTAYRTIYDLLSEDNASDEDEICFGGASCEPIVKAETAEEAVEIMKKSVFNDGENPEDYIYLTDEMSVDECIKHREGAIDTIIRDMYFDHMVKENVTGKEYAEHCKKYENDKNFRYEVLGYVIRVIFEARSIQARVDTSKISAKDCENLIFKLAKAKSTDEVNELVEEANQKIAKLQ